MTNEERWLVKVRRYEGGTSIVSSFFGREMAEANAGALNEVYQTDTHYVEKFNPDIYWQADREKK